MPGLEDLAELLGASNPEVNKPQKKRGYDGNVVVLKVREEKRRGKVVTIAWGFQSTPDELDKLLALCKRTLGAGGQVTDNAIELQGAHVDRLKALLRDAGYAVHK